VRRQAMQEDGALASERHRALVDLPAGEIAPPSIHRRRASISK